MPYSVLCLSHQGTQVQSGVPKQGKRTDIAERCRVLQGPDYLVISLFTAMDTLEGR